MMTTSAPRSSRATEITEAPVQAVSPTLSQLRTSSSPGDDDGGNHASSFVRGAEVLVRARCVKGVLVGLAGVHIARVPRLGTGRQRRVGLIGCLARIIRNGVHGRTGIAPGDRAALRHRQGGGVES